MRALGAPGAHGVVKGARGNMGAFGYFTLAVLRAGFLLLLFSIQKEREESLLVAEASLIVVESHPD